MTLAYPGQAAFELESSVALRATCAHCGLPVPEDSIGPQRFCCAGCRSVYELLHAQGLAGYYAERARSRASGRPAKSSGRHFAEFDSPAYRAERCAPAGHGCSSSELYLEGVHCSACVWLVEHLPRTAPGVLEARLDVARSLVRVTWDPARIQLSQVARALDQLGYTPHAAPAARKAGDRAADRALLVRIGVAGFSAGNVMLMAFALYSGAFSGMDAEYAALFRWGSALLALPSVLYAASPFFRGAAVALRTRSPHMDLPIAIGISIGFASGVINTLRGRGEVFFDSLATLIFLLLVGRWLQQRHHRRAADTAELAAALAPRTARVLHGETWCEVDAASVPPGTLVEVGSGERVPVDGSVERGSSSVDLALLTGESRPVAVQLGDRVYAGTTNLGPAFTLRCERAGRDTRVGKLLESIETTQQERAPIVRLADSIAGRFTVAVLVLAALAAWAGSLSGAEHAVERAVALLVVTCPCALGMATPLAVSVALRRAAAAGLLFKGGEHLEALARPGYVVFDKTGTLTEGAPALVEYEGSRELLRLAAAVERDVEHPLARALRRSVEPCDLRAENVQIVPGRGVRGEVAGEILRIGSPKLFEADSLPVPRSYAERASELAARGLSPVLIGRGAEIAGIAGFGDALRPGARETLQRLAAHGYQLLVLSGDEPRVVERVCHDLPLTEAHGGMTPEGKLSRVRELMATGNAVVMVGDGVNDAAAMSAATVGFAVHGGAEASLLVAHAFSTRPGIAALTSAVEGARHTLGVIRRGMAFSLLYNAAGVVLAMTGLLSPLLAAILMPLSSITVVSSALHSRAFREVP